jgi:23S rRNA pseudouridine1911/1915/1917 synthase
MRDWDELVSERLYVALVEGNIDGESGPSPSSGTFDSWLKEDDKGRVFRAKPGERGSKRAITRWRLLDQGSELSLLELSLETGRKHQIRVQLADSGHPILGDERYGSKRDDLGRLALHATTLELRLPGREKIRIESPAPKEFARALKARLDPKPEPKREPRREPKAHAPSARRASASSSPNGARSGARPKRASPRG